MTFPTTNARTDPYWNRNLSELRQRHAHDHDHAAHELVVARVQFQDSEPGAYSSFEKDANTGESRRRPELVRVLNAAFQEHTTGNLTFKELLAAELHTTLTPSVPPNESLKHEVEVSIARHRKKNEKNHYEIRTALNLFLTATGDISFRATTPQHSRVTS